MLEYIYSQFYYDFSIRRVIEFSFPIVIFILFIVNKYYINIHDIKYYISVIFILWSGLALIGFFIPSIKELILIMHPCNNPKIDNFPNGPGGIPIELKIKARGGFIAGRKIKIKATVKKFDKKIDIMSEFKKSFDKFSLVWFDSFCYPIVFGSQIGTQSAGGVEIKPGKSKGRAIIIFNTQGDYGFRSIYKFKGDDTERSENYEKIRRNRIIISPSENSIALRNFSISYSLTLIVLFFTILQLHIF